MKSITIVLVLVAAAAARLASLEWEWAEFKIKHNKQYKNEQEELFRKKLFEKSKKKVEDHNKKYEEGLFSYTIGINQFSDMTPEEYLPKVPCFNIRNAASSNSQRTQFVMPVNATIPDEVDWRQKGAVSRVKDQQRCGSCWAFSTTGAVEGQHAISSGKMVELSEQNLVDCDRKKDNGCHGGFMDDAFQYIIDNGGIDTEASYPYEGREGECRYNKETSGATVSSFVDIKSGSEEDLKHAVATKGPVSVAINADANFQFYRNGVFYDESCASDPSSLDHGVLVVGYGKQPDGVEYWIVKNSWSEKWGNKGYILMARNRHNNCGIATMASYPQV